MNYGVEDGLRSAQCSPGYPIGGGGNRTIDGRLWFTTSRGLAVFDAAAMRDRRLRRWRRPCTWSEMTADGQPGGS